MGKERVVLDTNTIISGLAWKGTTRIALIKTITNYEWITSEKQIKEIKRVLNYPKFGFDKKQINNLLLFMEKNCVKINSKTKLNIIKEDPHDNFLLELAIDGKSNIIVSGDKHLLNLIKYKQVKIINASEFIKKY